MIPGVSAVRLVGCWCAGVRLRGLGLVSGADYGGSFDGSDAAGGKGRQLGGLP